MAASNAVFAFVLAIGAGFFALNVQRLLQYMQLGKSEDRTNDPFTRIKNVIQIGIAQTKIFRDPVAGSMHALIFWGFMILTAGTVEILIQGVFSGFSYALILPQPVYQLYSMSQDGFALIVIAAIGFAFYRRLVLHPKRLEGDKLEHTDALIILSMIGGLMVTLLLTNACQFLIDPASVGPEKFVSRGLAMAIAPIDPAPTTLVHVFFWAHSLLILTFLNYLPYSKHLHVVTSLINVYLSNTSGLGTKGAMRPMDLEAEVEAFGAADVEQLTWKNLLDGYSCTECGRCTSVCPANITGKPLSPRKIIINSRQRLMEKAPLVTNDRMSFLSAALVHGEGEIAEYETPAQILEHRLLDNYITEDELWACTSCRACVQGGSSSDRSARRDQRDAPLPRAERVAFPRRDPARVRVDGCNGSPWAFSPRSRGGGRDEHRDDGRDEGARRSADRALLGWLHGFLR